MPAEQWLDALRTLERRLEAKEGAGDLGGARLERLSAYYHHLAELAAGYEKDPARREESVRIVRGWQRDVEALTRAIAR